MIIVTAGGPEVPPSLMAQLAVAGRLVMPVGNWRLGQRLVRLTRTGPDDYRREELEDVAFVPLIGKEGWRRTLDRVKTVIEASPVRSRRGGWSWSSEGFGHPDTICDPGRSGSRRANRLYLAEVGIQHYNIDKAMLVAGQCVTGFGRGEVTRPVVHSETGRRSWSRAATTRRKDGARGGRRVDSRPPPTCAPGRISKPASRWRGPAELRGIFGPGSRPVAPTIRPGPRAAPPEPHRQIVLAVEQFLNGTEFKRRFPDTGPDVKVFGLREEIAST